MCSLVLAVVCSAGDQAAGPQLASGQEFEFKTVAAEESTKAGGQGPLGTFEEQRGLAMVEPLPYNQSVKIGEQSSCDDHSCVAIEISQDVPPFVPGLEDMKCGKTIRAKIDLTTGDVMDIRTELIIGDSISNSKQDIYGTDSTLGHFYGPWMIELEDDYKREFEHSTGELRTIKVVGREKVKGRECFVVKRARALPSGQKLEGTVWVDVERKVALRVHEGDRIMHLVVD
jgi:hypothetical protein